MRIPLSIVAAAVSVFTAAGAAQTPAPSPRTKVVMLGTGTPNADPERSGPAVAIVIEGQSYLVDAGPGVVRRANAAARDHSLPALRPPRLQRVFLTHLHSDHTLGLPDLMFTPWVLERTVPLEVVGPPGTRAMTEHLEAAYREDIAMRLYGLEPRSTRNYRAVVKELTGGAAAIYKDALVTVDAIAVAHGSWPEAFGFKFTSSDRTVVISGDARSTAAIADACNGCDVLVHEVYSAERFKTRAPEWQTYHASFHTSTVELAQLATKARPKLLVLYHQLYWGATDDDLVREIKAAGYAGAVVSAKDLVVY